MRDYYVFYPQLRMPRLPLLRLAWRALHETEAVWGSKCEELKYDLASHDYRSTGRMLECDTLKNALSDTMEWQGAYFYFECSIAGVRGSMALVFWNDQAADQTTFALFENSALFNHQREHAPAWAAFQRLLIEIADLLDAPFCWMECNPPLRTVGEDSITGLLDLIQRGRRVPLFLAVHPRRFPQATKLHPAASHGYAVRKDLGYLLISDKDMGVPEED